MNYMEVSVYAVHHMIIAAMRSVVRTVSAGFEAAIGDMIAKNEMAVLARNFQIYELVVHEATVIIFTATALLINPFISVYTRSIVDIGYARPVFAYILVLAEGIYCLRIPYQIVSNAAGHYRQTRNVAFVEAGINFALSVALVRHYGITGVAIGTLIAIFFRTIQCTQYSSQHILHRRFYFFIKRMAVSVLSVAVIIAVVWLLPVWTIDNYLAWIFYAGAVTAIAIIAASGFNFLFYRGDVENLIAAVIDAFKKAA
jgi:O-antigen/teichoic acid export membrane protein